jgi:hypothetical protein
MCECVITSVTNAVEISYAGHRDAAAWIGVSAPVRMGRVMVMVMVMAMVLVIVVMVMW